MDVRPGIHRTLDATPAAVAAIRTELAQLAESLGADEEIVEGVRLASSEAATNVVIHAYRDQPGPITVTAVPASGELWVLISDEGCGHQASGRRPGLGWGLALIAEATDSFVVAERAGGGTEVRMCFRLDPDRAVDEVPLDADRSLRAQLWESSRPASSAAGPNFSTTT